MSQEIEVQKGSGHSVDCAEKGARPLTTETAPTNVPENEVDYPIRGWRVAVIITGICLSLFMIQSEASVASTALVAITDDLGGFDKSAWIFTAYFLTFSGSPIILSRISDIYGRKLVITACVLLFTIMSAACGAAQSLIQLIMFRWLQGFGAGGIMAIGTMYGYELRPKEKWAAYSGIVFFAATVSYSIAPVVGAAFTDSGHWRWIFLYCVPIGAVAFLLLLVGMPTKLPLEPAGRRAGESAPGRGGLARLDFIGALALLSGSVLLTTALQEAASGASFASPKTLVALVIAPCCWIFFLGWELYVTRRNSVIEPLISWDVLSNRVFIGLIINATLVGAILAVVIVQIPQRLTTVYQISEIDAGVRLMPVTTFMAFVSALTSILTSKVSIPAVYWLFIGAIFQIAGAVGLSKSSTTPPMQVPQYIFEALIGAGTGMLQCLLILLPIYVVERKHHAVTNGASNQFRQFGSSLGVSITVCASNSRLRDRLTVLLTPAQVVSVLDRTDLISQLPLNTEKLVREVFGEIYNLQMTIVVGFAVAVVAATVIMWQRKNFDFGS